MNRKRFRLTAVAAVLVALTCVAIAFAATGVKTAKPPYLVPTAPGVIVDPILSTGDIVPTGQVPAYQMSGIPDGLGAYSNRRHNDGHQRRHGRSNLGSTYTVLMNHELGSHVPRQPAGREHAHLEAEDRPGDERHPYRRSTFSPAMRGSSASARQPSRSSMALRGTSPAKRRSTGSRPRLRPATTAARLP